MTYSPSLSYPIKTLKNILNSVDNRSMNSYTRDLKMHLLLSLTLAVTVTISSPTYAELIPVSNTPNARSGDSAGSSQESFHPLNRSERFKDCEKMPEQSWKDILSNPTGDYLSKATGLNEKFFPQLRESLVGAGTTSNGDDAAQKKNNIIFYFNRVLLCHAYAVSTDIDNYDKNLDQFTDDQEYSSALGAGGLECMNQPTDQAKQQCMAQNAGQGELKCTQEGPETHDYIKCKSIIKFIDGFGIGKQVMQVQQTFRAGSQQLEAQGELAKKARSEEGVQITDAMGVQRDSLEQQGNLAYEMAAFDAAKAGTLMSMIASFPRPNKKIEKCENNFGISIQQYASTFLETLALPDPQNIPITPQELVASAGSETDVCVQAISTRDGENFLFENQAVIDTVKGIAIKAGLEALANGVKGALLHDQAGMVDDAINDIESFEPPEFPVAEVPEATASECLVDPEAVGCIAPNGVSFEGFRDGGFNANIGGSANLGDLSQAGLDSDEDSNLGAGNTDRSLIPNEFGIVQAEGSSDNSFTDGAARAGSIKTGQAAAGGGGAGAGGGGGGGLGGGGGSRGPASKKAPSGTRDIKIKTKGDGLRAVGGRGRIGSKKSKPDNPFSKLLGKNKKSANNTLNFRGPAQLGGKKGSIFQMITNRYNSVQSKDRLLKYEAKKP
jgi:uncharacterized membrane protein YgcG